METDNPGYLKVKEYLLELGCELVSDDEVAGEMVVSDDETSMRELRVICSGYLVVLEQFMFEVKEPSIELYKKLLQKNRELIHGAYVLDETGNKVIFRDTLQMENLDMNELESSLNALNLLLSEGSPELNNFSTN